MSSLRNIALTVQELENGEFYWVLLEATDDPVVNALPYTPLDAATRPCATYAQALAEGVAELQRRQALEDPLAARPAPGKADPGKSS
ncbi:MAG: hypothetical protein JWQ03_974 [Variovorax sp.]|nr:hypothetical protein [Variovorax sp.]